MYQLETRKYWSDSNVQVQFEFRNPQSPFPLHVHDFHEIALIYSGKATHITANGDREIQGGDLMSIKPGQAHGYKNIQNLVLMNILLKHSFFYDDRFGLHSIPAFTALFSKGTETDIEKSQIAHYRMDYSVFCTARDLIEKANNELNARSDGYRAMVVSLVQELIILILRNYKKNSMAQPSFAQNISNLFGFVKNSYKTHIDIETLTAISGMSESQVFRAFKHYMDCTPVQYINKLRLSSAVDALIQTDRTITDIALDLGFNDSNYFTRLFRKHLKFSPREYRKKHFSENIL